MKDYTVICIPDYSDAAAPLWVAYDAAMPTCVAQGQTPEEAEANLANVRPAFIAHFKAHNLPLPTIHRATTSNGNNAVTIYEEIKLS